MASTTSRNPSLRLRLRRATPADLPDIVRIHFDAFGPCIMHRLMRPDGGSDSARAHFGRSISFSPEDGEPGAAGTKTGSSSPAAVESFTMVAEAVPAGEEDAAAPEVVAFAKWKLVREPLAEGARTAWNARRDGWTAEELGEGTNAEVYAAYIGGLHGLRERWIGEDPCLHLGILACSPAHQHLGAGTALLAWGGELADKEGKATWLEASPPGYPLYRRFAYEDVDVQDLAVTERWGPVREEGEDWGQDAAVALAGELPRGSFRTVLMRRLPRVSREAVE